MHHSAIVPVFENHPLEPYNTFKIKAKSRFFAEISHETDYLNLLNNYKELSHASKLVLGGGSNILFVNDFNGWILKNNIKGYEILEETNTSITLRIGAGENWHQFVLWSIEKNWGGIENLVLIPGTVGAAPIQNIGAYGAEVKNTILHVEALSLEDGKMHVIDNSACQFGYRNSIFKHKWRGKLLITRVVFRLNKNFELNLSYGTVQQTLAEMNIVRPTLRDISQAIISIRKSKLPDPEIIGNCGSFFKNPEISINQFEQLKQKFPNIVSFPTQEKTVKISAGWLIEQCGWKGKSYGNAAVYDKQALVIINKGNATGKEILTLAQQIIDSVRNTFDIVLEPEVNIIL
ncbi:MAG: UDP-N-acetylmuramate dehydrogenase [Cytophagales bacterium]|nr:UDP-N-acetylmuramate dehydrogenase [Cytophagales bacterium]MDW8385311.1 UDP-N-acetylmuramate dehydrogenase [Flammeovirgaceae bacterium]